MKLVFWICTAVLGWTYLAYPVGMVARSRWATRLHPRPDLNDPAEVRRRAGRPENPPLVSVVLAVRDGVDLLPGRIDNLLAQDYPADLLEVLVVSNGSRDGTDEAARDRAAAETRVTALTSPAEEGKAGAINAGARTASGEVLVFADVRQRFDPDAVSRLVDALLDHPEAAAVTGRLVVGDAQEPGIDGFNRYWELETHLRMAESTTGSVMGATGAIYAAWKRWFRPIPPGTLLDDVYLPARIILDGGRVIMERRAVARDEPTRSVRREYLRRVRTLAGNLQLVTLLPELLRPRNPVFIRFISHKLLRVLSPLFFLGLVTAGLWIGSGPYLWAAGAVLAIAAAGLAGLLLPIKALALPSAFVLVHVAAVAALVRRRTADLWVR